MVLIVKPADNDGVMLNVFVPLISTDVYAAVGVMAVPTVTLTVCDEGEIEAAAETLEAVNGATRPTATTRQITIENDRLLPCWKFIVITSSYLLLGEVICK